MQLQFFATLVFLVLCFASLSEARQGIKCVKNLNIVRNSRIKRQANNCVDGATNCPQFRQFCTAPQYVNCMLTNCRQTCGFCTPGAAATTAATTTTTLAGG